MDGQGGGDIFEELAMLDSVEPVGEHPQFMQNLGFGPDLDLAEFFGPDYQPSNPLLAYMQPSQGGSKQAGDHTPRRHRTMDQHLPYATRGGSKP